MKKVICSILIVLVILFLFPLSAYAADYGSYCCDDLNITESSVPDFSSLILSQSSYCVVLYNSSDSTFYLLTTSDRNGTASCALDLYNGSLCFYPARCNYKVFHYTPATDSTWTQDKYNWNSTNDFAREIICSVNSLNKFCFLYCSKNISYTDSVVYTVSGSVDSSYIVANFLTVAGVLTNPASVNSGGSGGSGGSGSVDLTSTNTKIDDVKTAVEDFNDDFDNFITNHIVGIKSDIAAIKTAVLTFGAKLDSIITNTSNTNTSVSGLRSDFSNFITNHILGIKSDIADVKTYVSSLTTNSSSVLTKLDNMYLELQKIYNSLSSVIGYQGGATLYSLVSSFKSDFADFVSEWESAASMFYNLFDDFINTDFPDFVDDLDDKFTTLYNILIYGNEDGTEDEVTISGVDSVESGLSSVNSSASDAVDIIDDYTDGVSAYITTFTDFYNRTMALNVGLSAIVGFGLVLILVRKVIGR